MPIKFIIGTKIDESQIIPETRKVSFEEANDFAIKNKCTYHEVSALSDINIKESFAEVLF